MLKTTKKDIKLGERIAWLRKFSQLEQKEAAKEIGINEGTYQHYEYGNHPSRKNMEMLVKHYKCNKAWLLTGEGEPWPNIRSELRETQSAFKLISTISHNADYDQAKRDLEVIFDSKNDVLIKAIQANLSAFKAAANAEKEKLKMADDMVEMKKSIKRLEDENKALKGCAGGSPPLDLSPDKCAPTGTEDPET